MEYYFKLVQNLQQQKLLELTSQPRRAHLSTLIYNSRNYQSLLAVTRKNHSLTIYNSRNYQSLLALTRSSGVHLLIYNSRNYQSLLANRSTILLIIVSTIVEIIRAYQPNKQRHLVSKYLQQQKLLELTSLGQPTEPFISIYNSRNYQSLLA